ncbi:MAG: ABC transporter substrate-binding protein [Pseudorhodoplanes sp.]
MNQMQKTLISRRAVLAGTASTALAPLHTQSATASTPKRGGRLRLGIAGGSSTDTLDPGRLIDAVGSIVSFQARNTLVELLPTLRPAPELAVSWESSPDARVWTFELRKGVEFHNGKSFEAEDVIFTINHHRAPNNKSGAAGFVKPIQDVKADGKSRVIFTLHGPNADFPLIMSVYRLPIMPDGTTDFSTAIGTGAYVLQSFQPGVKAFAVKNKNYWRSDRGFVDEVETVVINNTSARTNALLSGSVDVVNRLDPRTVDLLKNNSAITVRNDPGFKYFTMPMLTDVAPYDNNDVRLALKWGIDREQIVEKILFGLGRVGNDHPITPDHRYFNTELPQRKYDPDRARFHLKKAGATDHVFELHASEASFEGAVDAAVLYQDIAAKAGIKNKINRQPVDGYFTNVWRKVPFCTSYSSSRATEDAVFSLNQSSNEARWTNERWAKLLVAARGELDTKKRQDMYFEMQKLMSEDGGMMVPLWINNVSASSRRVKAPERVSIANEMDAYRVAERWWIE